MLTNHLSILQVLTPLCGALLCLFSFNKAVSKFIAITSISIATLLSIYGLYCTKITPYFLGNWQAPIGIEYKLDFLNKPIIVYINIVLLFNLLFCNYFIENTVLKYIEQKRQNLFYAVLLFAHFGYLGILSTNDLFNLYVFAEIAAFSTCILMSQGCNPRAVLGAFDYLILGTIGTTLILIGIGFLFTKTGSLNISDIKANLTQAMYASHIVIAGAAFFIIGCLLKMAFFPMHFWMVRAYQYTSSIILTYLAGISGVVGVYIFLRFVNFALDYEYIQAALTSFLKPLGLFTMTLCSVLAFKSENLKKIIIYSLAAQVGYVVLLLSIGNNYSLILQFLLIDSINKIAMFLIMSYLEDANVDLDLRKIKAIDDRNKFMRILIVLNLICSSGLPICSMFIIKISILEHLIKNSLFISLLIVIITSIISLLYHYKIAKPLLFNCFETVTYNNKLYSLTLITIMQFLGIIFVTRFLLIS